jgi:hypothetical protein
VKIVSNTNFNLLGDRNYVNSFSIIEYIYLNHTKLSGWDIEDMLLDIKFYKLITCNCVVGVSNEPVKNISEEILCEAVISCEIGKCFIYFKKNASGKKLGQANINYNVMEIEVYGNYSGNYKIRSDSYGQFVKNLIEANKRVHLQSNIGKSLKVINMYMRNIPLFLDQNIEWSELQIKNIGLRKLSDGSISTLNKVRVSRTIDVHIGFNIIGETL